jgi:hypothetical protein
VLWTNLGNVAWGRAGMKTQDNKNKFLERLDQLFEIASCQHEILLCEDAGCQGCQDGAHTSKECSCSRDKKIPKMELLFIKSMREFRPVGTKSKMMMGGMDKKENKRQVAAEERKAKEASNKELKEKKEKDKEKELEERSQVEQLLQDEENEAGQLDELVPRPVPDLGDSGDEDSEDEDWEQPDHGARRAGGLKRNRMPIPNTALAAVRFTLAHWKELYSALYHQTPRIPVVLLRSFVLRQNHLCSCRFGAGSA